MNYIRLAWRNIWRNKRRTVLTAASIFMAVFLALLVRSIQTGWFDNLINVVTESYTGHIQIHKKGYWDDKDINNSMYCNDSLLRVIQSVDNVTHVVPRLEYFALSSFKQQTKGVLLIGTDPGREDNLTHLSRKIIQGKYLDNTHNGILVAQRLASFLGRPGISRRQRCREVSGPGYSPFPFTTARQSDGVHEPGDSTGVLQRR
jgi:ABC-type lipoprotein release transport system permease subunit